MDHPVDMTPLTAEEFYGPNLAIFQYSSTHLYAHLRVLIYLGHDVFTIYTMTTHPLPFDTNLTNFVWYTRLELPLDRWAVNTWYDSYVSFQQADISQCNPSKNYI